MCNEARRLHERCRSGPGGRAGANRRRGRKQMKSSSGFFGRTSVYVLLIAAAAVFLTPFLWLALSSLKPLDQAMAMPPTLFPRAYYAPIDGARREVIVDGPIARPGIVADVTAGPDAGRRV